MAIASKPEVWLRGPLPGITPTLQPVAHTLLQAREELNEQIKDFNDKLLWQRPAGAASAGFHLQHMKGVLERLFNYAKGKMLTELQLKQLAAEGDANPGQTVQHLLQQFNEQVDKSLAQLSGTSADELFEVRFVGRAKIPSTVIGILFHAAEHTMRHLGQLLVTVKVVSMTTE